MREHSTRSSEIQRFTPQRGGAPVPGKQTLVEPRDAEPSAQAVHAAAARATATPAHALPFAASIQRAFGRHDISGIQAHTAPDAAREMGAAAFAHGERVVLGERPDLFTVAHEAAHVVQQRAGVRVPGGVGTAGDVHEQHADEVARAVVAGQSAEAILDRVADPTRRDAAAPAVQRITAERLDYLAGRMEELAERAPERGVNLWVARFDELDLEIHLLGTGHGVHIDEVGTCDDNGKPDSKIARDFVIQYLQSEPFTHVISETTLVPAVQVSSNLIGNLDRARELQKTIDETDSQSAKHKRALGHLGNLDLGRVDVVALDDAYAYVAQTTPSGEPKARPPIVGTLETKESREQATKNNKDDGIDSSRKGDEKDTDYAPVREGNARTLFRESAKMARSHRELADCEERNDQWMAPLGPLGKAKPGDKQLWICGAAHLAGLLVRFQDLGWSTTHRSWVSDSVD